MAAPITAALAGVTAPFRVGTKELFLPSFRVILKRSHLPPTQASFIVPLCFSKLDLRDYLYHAYAVETTSIRSYVKQTRVMQGKPSASKPSQNRWHRPRATKHMTVDLVKPFVWPEGPESYKEWNLEQTTEAAREGAAMQKKSNGQTADQEVDESGRKSLREQAKALLEGRTKWSATRAGDMSMGGGR